MALVNIFAHRNRIRSKLRGINPERDSSGSIKQAILVALGETVPEASLKLEKSKGNLRQSMQALK